MIAPGSTMTSDHGFLIPGNLQNILEISLLGIAMILLLTDKRQRTTETLLLIAIATLGRILMAPLPNIQPVTILVMLTAIRLGAARGASLGILVAYLSNLYLGGGSWTIVQASAWGIVGLTTDLAAQYLERSGNLLVGRLCVASVIAAFAFGFITTIPLIQVYGFNIWLMGLPFDLLHAIGNVTIAVWFAAHVDRMLSTQNNRVAWTWANDNTRSEPQIEQC